LRRSIRRFLRSSRTALAWHFCSGVIVLVKHAELGVGGGRGKSSL
jgi:hypothetical protein